MASLSESELENKIQDLSQQLIEQKEFSEEEIQRTKKTIQELEGKVRNFENDKLNQLKFPLDINSKNVLNDYLVKNLSNILWRKIFYHSSTFETIDTTGSTTDASWELTKTGTAVPDAVLTTNGFTIYTGTTDANRSVLSKNPSTSDILIGKNSRFRTTISISAVTNQTSYITSGGALLASTVGFKIAENALYGMITDASSVETLTSQLATISAATAFHIEARYYPFDRRFVFYYSAFGKPLQEMAGITGDLAALFSEQASYGQIGFFRIATSNTTTKGLTCSLFEFMQER